MKESGERRKQRRKPPTVYCQREVIDSKFVQTKAYLDAQCKGSYKKNQNRKALTGVN